MPKKKESVEVAAELPATTYEEAAGESPKKKKKKKKRKRTISQEEGEEGEESSLNFTFPSLTTTPSSPGLMSPGKKKKKKKKSLEQSLTLPVTMNGVREEEEEEGKTKKKKKKRRKSDTATEEEEEKKEEEEEMVAMEEPVTKKKKKKRKEEEISPMKEEKISLQKEEDEISPMKEEEISLQKEEEEISPRKKKKKKRKQEEEEEEAALKLEKNKQVQASPSASSTPSTPSTKGKKKAKVKEAEKEEEEEEEEEEGLLDWTQEETFDVLERVKGQCLKDKRACRATLKGVDWESAAPPGHSPKATQKHFQTLYKKISHFKTLASVVDDIRGLMESGKLRPSRPMERFFHDYFTKERKEAAKKKGESVIQMAQKAWKNLSEEEKEVYRQGYRQELAQTKHGAEWKNIIKRPRLPHQLYWDDTTDHSSKKGNRTRYMTLDPSQQLRYIRSSLEEQVQYQSKIETYSATHPGFSAPPCPAMVKYDLKLYLDAHGYPEVPPARPQLAFYRDLLQKGELEDLSGLRKMGEALKRYRDLSPQKQLVWKNRHAKSTESYEADLKAWVEGQDEVTKFALKKYQNLMKATQDKKVKVKPRPTKLQDVFPHTAPTVLTQCPKFFGEPPRPVPTPFKLFTLKLRVTYEDLSGTALQRALREGWKGLTAEEVSVYELRCKLLHREYEKEVKGYVRQMDPKTRRLYLGFNRYTLFKFFGNRDVFAEEFPNSEEYPVFLKGQKQPPAGPTKPQEEEEVEEEEEEEEEDEEEEEEVSNLRKVRKLSPAPFSSLKHSPTSSSASPIKKKAPPPPPVSDSEEEEEEEEEEEVSNLRKVRKLSPAQFSSLKHSPTSSSASPIKKKAPPPPPVSDSEEEEEEEEEEEKVPSVSLPKKSEKKSPASASPKKKGKQPPPPPKPQSDSDSDEDDEDEIAPAWLSPQVTQPKKPLPQKKKKAEEKYYSSSSSGFSD